MMMVMVMVVMMMVMMVLGELNVWRHSGGFFVFRRQDVDGVRNGIEQFTERLSGPKRRRVGLACRCRRRSARNQGEGRRRAEHAEKLFVH